MRLRRNNEARNAVWSPGFIWRLRPLSPYVLRFTFSAPESPFSEYATRNTQHEPLHVSRFTFQPAFTLIELILVMAILTMAVSVTAPTLSNFFRGRTLDSEARRFLALTRSAQSRAVTEGVPMDLWLDASQKQFGLEAEPSYEDKDSKAVSFTLDTTVQLEVVNRSAALTANTSSRINSHSATFSVPKIKLAHPSVPTIRFLPDGSIADSSPQMLHLTGHDGSSLWVAQSRDRLTYEIRSSDQP